MKPSGSWWCRWHTQVAQFKCSITELFVKMWADFRGSKWKWISFRILIFSRPDGPQKGELNNLWGKSWELGRNIKEVHAEEILPTGSREEPINSQHPKLSLTATLQIHINVLYCPKPTREITWVSCLEPRIASEREKGGPGQARKCVESLSWFNLLEI